MNRTGSRFKSPSVSKQTKRSLSPTETTGETYPLSAQNVPKRGQKRTQSLRGGNVSIAGSNALLAILFEMPQITFEGPNNSIQLS